MNVLYCGDSNIKHGLIMSVLSLAEHSSFPLNVYVLTAGCTYKDRKYTPLSNKVTDTLDRHIKAYHPHSFVKLIDITELFGSQIPSANLGTRFTPMCMLRLYADKVGMLPSKILYLDYDVVCTGDPSELYCTDLGNNEFAGVLDRYGKWFFRRSPLKMDYVNSGVLLLDLDNVRKSGLFRNCLDRCRTKKMLMPDQSALNKLSAYKLILPSRFNEQKKLSDDTVFRHFSATFSFWPYFHPVKVKPWEKERVHTVLKTHVFDKYITNFENFLKENNI